MKINILVSTRSGGRFAGDFIHSSVTGKQVSGSDAPEDEIITNIDEEDMSAEKFVASRFLTFLGNQRLTLESLALLSKTEQERIRQEFLNGN